MNVCIFHTLLSVCLYVCMFVCMYVFTTLSFQMGMDLDVKGTTSQVKILKSQPATQFAQFAA